MFGDFDWIESRSAAQEAAWRGWLDWASRIVVVEIGAGTAIPSVRSFSHEASIDRGARIVRINPCEPAAPSPGDVSIAAGALESLAAIDALLRSG